MFHFQLWNEEEASPKCSVSAQMTDGGKKALWCGNSNVSVNITVLLVLYFFAVVPHVNVCLHMC